MRASSLLRFGVHHVGRVAGNARIHPHVERGVEAVAEAALPPVELRRGHAEVEQHADDRLDRRAGGGDDLGQLVEPGVDGAGPFAVTGQPLGGDAQRIGVLVDAEDGDVVAVVEQRNGMAGAADRGIDDRAGRHRLEELDHPVDQYGRMGEGTGRH